MHLRLEGWRHIICNISVDYHGTHVDLKTEFLFKPIKQLCFEMVTFGSALKYLKDYWSICHLRTWMMKSSSSDQWSSLRSCSDLVPVKDKTSITKMFLIIFLTDLSNCEKVVLMKYSEVCSPWVHLLVSVSLSEPVVRHSHSLFWRYPGNKIVIFTSLCKTFLPAYVKHETYQVAQQCTTSVLALRFFQ